MSRYIQEPTPATEWSDSPWSITAAEELLQDVINTIAVCVMNHEESVRRITIPNASSDAVIDIVIETTTGFDMRNYYRRLVDEL